MFDPLSRNIKTLGMRRISALLLVFILAVGCQSGDEEPPETFVLLPEADVNAITGVVWEGTARITECVSDPLFSGNYTDSRCYLIQNNEQLAFQQIPRNFRLSLSLWENNRIQGFMHSYITHYDGVPYDFTFNVEGTTEVGSGKDTVLYLTADSSQTANGEAVETEDYITRLSEFRAEEEEFQMPGTAKLFLNKAGIDETVILTYSFILQKTL